MVKLNSIYVVDIFQLHDSERDLFFYDEVVVKFDLVCNNASFINYVKLISAIPDSWLFDDDSNPSAIKTKSGSTFLF